jgi:hypothetical protein
LQQAQIAHRVNREEVSSFQYSAELEVWNFSPISILAFEHMGCDFLKPRGFIAERFECFHRGFGELGRFFTGGVETDD